MKRSVLDALARDYRLDERAVSAALECSGARPDAAAWRRFATRLFAGAGVGLLGAGVIFFIAANWDRFGAFGRFALLEIAIVACAAAAWHRPPPHMAGRGALALAILLAGALLALFGQSYQTGADLYELFVAWAVLALPFALAANSGAAWAVWWGVANVAMGLYCGWLGPGHFVWTWIDRIGLHKAAMLLAPCAVNLAAAWLFAHLRASGHGAAAPRWLARLLLTVAFAYGTAASILAIVDGGWWNGRPIDGQEGLVIVGFAVASAAVAATTLQAKHDVFPMALVIGSWIAISTMLIVSHMKIDGPGALFLLALWLVVASTAAGYALMGWVRAWRSEDEPVEPAEAA